ncbi:Bacterial transcription activator, effector binding domain [compost metagenome]
MNQILALKDLGLSLEQIVDLLRSELPAKQLLSLLRTRQTALEEQIADDQARLARVAARLRQIEHEGQLPAFEVILKSQPAIRVASLSATIPTLAKMATDRCALFQRLYEQIAMAGLMPKSPELVLYHNREYVETEIQMEAAVRIDADPQRPLGGLRLYELPEQPLVASVLYRGRFMEVGQAISALFLWAVSNGYAPAGPFREIHLFGRELDQKDWEDVILEMQLPVVPTHT